MAISIDLTQFVTNADGSKNSNYPSGNKTLNGGDAQLGWSGFIGQGETITVSTDGTYNFGTRSNATQRFFQIGSEAWNSGVSVTLTDETSANDGDLITSSNAYHQMNMRVAKGAKCGERLTLAYQSQLDGQEFGEPATLGPKTAPDAATTDKNFFFQTTRFNTDLTYTVTASYSTSSGTFTVGDLDLFTKGERVTVAKSGGGNVVGNVIAVDVPSSLITFELDFGEVYNSTDNNGATITGDSSGATATLDGVTYIRPDGTKLIRTGTNNGLTPTNSDVEYNLIVTAAGQHAIDITTQASGRDDERPNANAQVSTAYQSRLWLVSAVGPDLEFSSFLESNRFDYTFTNSASYNFANVVKQLAVIDIGVEWPGGNNPSGHLRSRTNTVVVDYEYNSVLLADSSTFSTANKVSLCRNLTWGASSSSVALNYGEIPSGTATYMFVMDGDGTILNPASGVLIGDAP